MSLKNFASGTVLGIAVGAVIAGQLFSFKASQQNLERPYTKFEVNQAEAAFHRNMFAELFRLRTLLAQSKVRGSRG